MPCETFSSQSPQVPAGERWRFSRMLTQREMNASSDLSAIKALTFDVFGTAVDWRSGVAAEAGRDGALRGANGARARPADASPRMVGPGQWPGRRRRMAVT